MHLTFSPGEAVGFHDYHSRIAQGAKCKLLTGSLKKKDFFSVTDRFNTSPEVGKFDLLMRQDFDDVAAEIARNGSALVRHDIAEAMIASGDFEKWEGEGQATGFIALRKVRADEGRTPLA